jgi:hypothetical protein
MEGCGIRDELNAHAEKADFESGASASSATRAHSAG